MHYALYGYDGHPEAEYVIVVMGSGAVTCSETAKYLQEKGEKARSLRFSRNHGSVLRLSPRFSPRLSPSLFARFFQGFFQGFPQGFPKVFRKVFPTFFPKAFPKVFPKPFRKVFPKAFPKVSRRFSARFSPRFSPRFSARFCPTFPEGFPQGIPRGFPQGFPQGIPQGFPPGIPQGFPQGFPQGIPQGFFLKVFPYPSQNAGFSWEKYRGLSKATRATQVGVLKVRLFRPWDRSRFMSALPATCKRICVLDRTKDPGDSRERPVEGSSLGLLGLCCQEQGSQGEPLFLEVATTLKAMSKPQIVCIGGRYGLGSKEFTPNMVVSIYENLKKVPHFRNCVPFFVKVQHCTEQFWVRLAFVSVGRFGSVVS